MITDSELDKIGEDEVRHRFDRGDYYDPSEVSVVTRWLSRKDEEHRFDEACERANKSAALDSKQAAHRANIAATIAAIGAIVSAICTVIVLLKS